MYISAQAGILLKMLAYRLKIGTSGWSYGHWKGKFYPPDLPTKRWLSFYSQHFNTVEINSTFYRMPREKTVLNWQANVAEGFLFSVKMNRMITHIKRLKGVEESVKNFLTLCDMFKGNLGPILIQLPPGLKMDLMLLSDFIDLISKSYTVAVEFRNKTWFEDKIFEFLKSRNIIFCWHDYGSLKVPHMITANSLYIRMHGPSGRYAGSYTDDSLKELAKEIQESAVNRDVYVYFNNDIGGHAIENAKRLFEFVTQ